MLWRPPHRAQSILEEWWFEQSRIVGPLDLRRLGQRLNSCVNGPVVYIVPVNAYHEFEFDYFQDEDGMFTAKVPAIRGCVAWGKTISEAHFKRLFLPPWRGNVEA